jgi:DNA-binding MarR family transcriptional regulator
LPDATGAVDAQEESGILKYFYVILFYYGDTVDNEDIRNQIEVLRNELRALGNSFADLKQDDARTVLAMQVRSVMIERSERFFAGLERAGKLDGPAKRCRGDLDEFLEENIGSFRQGGKDMALKELLRYELGDHTVRSKGYPAGCRRYAKDMFEQLRSYYDASESIFSPIGRSAGRISSVINVKEEPSISPQTIEEALSPLASSWRIGILRSLSEEDDGLAELGRKLGLKKGHAQFHIKALLGPGYISYDRKSKLYSITAKGSEAYEGVRALVQRLSSL